MVTADPHAAPQNVGNSFTAATGVQEAAESAIWRFRDGGDELRAAWVNTDGCEHAFPSDLSCLAVLACAGAVGGCTRDESRRLTGLLLLATPANTLVYVPSADAFVLVGDVAAFEGPFGTVSQAVSTALFALVQAGTNEPFGCAQTFRFEA